MDEPSGFVGKRVVRSMEVQPEGKSGIGRPALFEDFLQRIQLALLLLQGLEAFPDLNSSGLTRTAAGRPFLVMITASSVDATESTRALNFILTSDNDNVFISMCLYSG
jgi:hypothetical protein